MILVRGFYTAGTKMTLRFQNGISISGSRNCSLDSESCDYAVDGIGEKAVPCLLLRLEQ